MKTILAFIAVAAFAFALSQIGDAPPRQLKNIEHDGHLFIQSKTGLIHHPACSCQSSLKAIRASQP